MVLEHAVGRFIKTTGASQQVTTGFQPKVIIFFHSEKSDDGYSSDAFGCYGISDTTRNRCMVWKSGDEESTSECISMVRNDACVLHISAGGSIEWEGRVSAVDATSFTITYDTNDTESRFIDYVALGGDDIVNVRTDTYTFPTSLGEFLITGVGFTPNLALFALSPCPTINTAFTDSYAIGIGWAKSTTRMGSVSVAGYSDKSPAVAWRRNTNASAITRLSSSEPGVTTSISHQADLVSFSSDTIELEAENVAGPDIGFYLALQLSDVNNITCGRFATPLSSPATQTVTLDDALANPVVAMLFMGVGSTLPSGTDNTSAEARISIGAATEVADVAIWTGDRNGDIPTTCVRKQDSDDSLIAHVENNTPSLSETKARGDIISFSDADFQINWDTLTGTAYGFYYLALASSTGGGAGGGAASASVPTAKHSHGRGGYY